MKHQALIPMGAITGQPGRDELRNNLDKYRLVGIDQFMIYPRSGLKVEYMGLEWLEICRHIIEYCAEYNMAVWLYDEYNWPSGKCKGKVIKTDPDFASKKLVAFADRNFMGIEDDDAPAPEYFWTKVSIPLYADLLNPAAVDCFIRLTHEVYYRHFGKYFGSTIKGIFSDEPSFMYAQFQPVSGNALEISCYNGLKEDYYLATGRDMIADFELHLSGHAPDDLWYTYYSLLGKKFCREYLGKIRNWCDAHSILFTGHLMSEPYPKSSINASGSPIDAIRSFSMPGLDEIGSHTSFEKMEWNTFKLVESAMNGSRTKALAELFALGPSDMTFTKMRYLIYIVALHGVNHFVTAVSALDAHGNVEKPYYYNPIAPTQPWFRYIGALNESATAAAALTEKKSTAVIALRYPQKVFCARWDHKNNPELKIDYSNLILKLINAQWEFRLIGDNEEAEDNYSVVLDLNIDGAIEEKSRKQFTDIPSILGFLERTMTRRATLRHNDGRIVERILLKSFDDGSICIVNTSDEYLRQVTLGNNSFDFPPRDVAVFPCNVQANEKTLDISNQQFKAKLENQNTLRCIFTDKRDCEFNVTEPIQVTIALRECGGMAMLTIDGNPLEPISQCSTLPEGIKSLYLETAMLTLTPGRHLLQLTNDAKDLPYLPLAFIVGPFGLGKDKSIHILKSPASVVNNFFQDNLQEYAGTVLFHGQVDLSGYDNISFEYKDLAIELLIEGKSQGARLWQPFTWSIPPEHLHGGVNITIRIATSAGPLFADYPNHVSGTQPGWLNDYWPGRKK